MIWAASGFIGKHRRIAEKVLYPIGVAYLFFGVVEYIKFFPFAAAMSFLAGVCIVAALGFIKK